MTQPPDSPARRRFLRRGAIVGVAATVPLSACSTGGRRHLGDFGETLRLLDFFAGEPGLRSAGAWHPAQVFIHCAQSIEFSLQGFPELKSELFRSSVGPAAAAVFAGLGRMRHDLAEPIPGAPALPEQADTAAALQRLRAAFETFRTHRGPLQPHFAYGGLAHEDYLFAHILHLDNHLDELHPLPDFLRATT